LESKTLKYQLAAEISVVLFFHIKDFLPKIPKCKSISYVHHHNHAFAGTVKKLK